jgi:hypothetical protein
LWFLSSLKHDPAAAVARAIKVARPCKFARSPAVPDLALVARALSLGLVGLAGRTLFTVPWTVEIAAGDES